jgi:glycosyltransferase involved in cell wall biosynthesis
MRSAAMVRPGIAERARPERLRATTHAGKKHICFVAPRLWPVLSRDPGLAMVGGAEVQQALLVRLLARAGHRVSVISLDFGQPDRAQVDGAVVHKTFRLEQGLPLVRFLHPRLTSIWRALREVDADVYYQRSASMLTGVVAEFCRRHGKRSIYAGASDTDFIPDQQLISLTRDRWLYRHGLRSVDRIVVQNPAQRLACREHYGRDARLIPSCYELPATHRAPSSPPAGGTLLWVGTVQPAKRPELVLELARRLPQRRFVMVGGRGYGVTHAGTDFFDRIRDQAAALPNVEFKGFLPFEQADAWFDQARVFVNTSRFEGMPNTFLQAWSRGVPTVATVDVGAPVYAIFDDPAVAVGEIERLLADDDYWRARSATCRGYFERVHSPQSVLAQYSELLEELTAEVSG